MASESGNEHDDHTSPDQVVPTFEVELDDVEESFLEKLPKEGENADTEGCCSVDFKRMIGKEEYRSGRWLQVSRSIYGYFILYFLQNAIIRKKGLDAYFAFVKFLPCFTIGFLQGFLIYKLLDGTPELEDTEFCANENTRFLFTCIIGIFFISMESGLLSIFNEMKILCGSKISFQVDCRDGQSYFAKNYGTDLISRCSILFVILFEFVVWLGVIIAGVKYILSIDPSDIGNVIQASVAIGFIDQIDDMALFVFASAGKKTESDHFCCAPMRYDIWYLITHEENMAANKLMIIMMISVGVVFGLSDSYC